MEIVVLKMLFIVSVSAQCGKHVYVQQAMSWRDAQRYCRNHYTDLSPITSKFDEEQLKVSGTISGRFWIGLYLDEEHWMWSGGGNAINVPWAEGEPNYLLIQKYGSVCWKSCNGNNGWFNNPFLSRKPFLCFNLIVVEKKRTWENAFSYCNSEHTALTSLASETEHLLALREIQQDHITERVWIGLRYLADRWMWMDGHPSVYRAWDKEDQDHQCPIWKRCATLTKGGVWEGWDCADQLNFICY